MALEYLSEIAVNSFIQLALAEDIGEEDYTTNACIPEDAIQKAELLVKDEGILAGVNMAERIFLKLDPLVNFKKFISDGEEVKKGDVAFEIEAKTRAILIGERLALNCMQRMSGIATKTHQLNQLIKHTSAKLLDTRKTTPNFRLMEKWAVVIGGGKNHRYDLSEMVMIKDNHIDYAGGVAEAISRVKSYLGKKNVDIPVEIEARNLKEVKEILEAGPVNRILLDNMNNQELKSAVEMIGNAAETEASGGITEATIKEIAETGVDYISVGALTHAVKSLDLSLKAV